MDLLRASYFSCDGKKTWQWTLAVLVFAVTFATFSPTLGFDFIFFDDPLYVTMSSVTRGGLKWEGLGRAFQEPMAGNYHPLVWISLMLDYSAAGLDSRFYHLTNVALHSINAAILFLLIRGLTGSRWTAIAIALAFALHPQRAESVAWVSGRKDLLSGLFCLLAIAAYSRWVAKPSLRRFSLVTAAVFAAMLSKPTGITLPLLFLCIDIWPLRRLSHASDMKRLLHEKIPWLLIAAFVSCMTIAAQSTQVRMATLSVISLQDRLTSVFVGYAHYIRLWLLPMDLAIIYPWSPVWPVEEVIFSILLFFAIGWLAWVCHQKAPWVAAGFLFFVLSIAPVSGIMQTGGQAYADRYTYLASTGLAMAVFFSLRSWATTRKSILLITIAICLVLGSWTAQTLLYLEEWVSTNRLFTLTYARTWQNWPAARVICAVHLSEGRYYQAVVWMRSYLARYPGDANMWNDLGIALASTGRSREAKAAFEESIRLYPTNQRASENLRNLDRS